MTNRELWENYKNYPTAANKKKIMTQYLNLVHYVIHHTKFQKIDLLEERDYFQFGIEGLSEAVDRFDYEYGTKFETYAIQRIRGKIIDEIRKLQIKPRPQSATDPNYKNVSLDESFDGNEGSFALIDVVPAEVETPEQVTDKIEEKEILIKLIKELKERDRIIITLYYYENLNYKEIAEVMNITVSRVSQIHTRILEYLKKSFDESYAR